MLAVHLVRCAAAVFVLFSVSVFVTWSGFAGVQLDNRCCLLHVLGHVKGDLGC
jgi:hypothetical protein